MPIDSAFLLQYQFIFHDRNDFGVRGAQFIIQSVVKVSSRQPKSKLACIYLCFRSVILFVQDPKGTDTIVEEFINSFEENLTQLSDEEFNVS